MPRNKTILDYYGAPKGSHCFYCPKYCSRYGMWAYRLAAEDYQDLVDRGWRRLGQYLFKPNNPVTCCPSYTIKCDAKEFVFTKSHKKILKKMNNFLKTGQKDESENGDHSNSNGDSSPNADSENGYSVSDDHDCDKNNQKHDVENGGESSASAEIRLITSNPRKPIDVGNVLKMIESDKECVPFEVVSQVESNNSSSTNSNKQFEKGVAAESPTQIVTAEPNGNNEKTNGSTKSESSREDAAKDESNPAAPTQLKAKALRLQRKKEKLEAKGITLDIVGAAKKSPISTEKNLKTFISEMPIDGKHRLKLKIINIHSDEFERHRNSEFELYARYQTRVHNDPPADMSEFNDFLCRSPIKHEQSGDGPECGFGTFHQQYWLDDTLLAVGVMDILPRGLSSVYFFYDPDLSFLTLGTYGTLREIEFIQQMNEKCPQLRGYYIGYYIPSVPKMLYKGKLQPSYLLCPEKYTYHLLDDDLAKLLQRTSCKRFNSDPMAEVNGNFDPKTDLKYLRLIVDSDRCMSYEEYKEFCRKSIKHVDSMDDDHLIEYGREVGKPVLRRSYLVISPHGAS